MKRVLQVSWVIIALVNVTALAENDTKKESNNSPPEADYTYEINGLTVACQNAGCEEDLLMIWEMGDGTVYKEPDFEHTYTEAGHYHACLTLLDKKSEQKISQKCKIISTPLCDDCELAWEPVCGSDNRTYMNKCFAEQVHGVYFHHPGVCTEINPELKPEYIYNIEEDKRTVKLINASYGSYDMVSWEFGDGEYSKQRNPEHTFKTAGDYEVCVTVTNSTTLEQQSWCEVIGVKKSAP